MTPLESVNAARTDTTASNPRDLLRSWHLARLRKVSLESRRQLTPAALINADKKHIEELILSSSRIAKVPGPFRHGRSKAVVLATLWSICAASAGVIVCELIFGRSDRSIGSITMVLAVLIGGGSLAVIYLLQQRIFKVLDDIGNHLIAGTGSEIDSYAEALSALREVLQSRDEHASGEALIVDAASDLLLCTDPAFCILATTQATCNVLLYLQEELVGSDLLRIMLPEDREKLLDGFAAARDGKVVTALELRSLTKYQTAIDLSWTIEWSESARLFFICARDVTDEKKLERARMEFLSTIAHDIKIPLSSIWVSLESLLEDRSGTLASRELEIAQRAENNVERLIALIDELLEYEQTKSGRLPLQYGSIVVSELLHESVAALSSPAEQKQIEISMQAPDVTIQADESKLNRVLVNLLSNAIKFSPPASTVILSAKIEKGMLFVRVRDSGPGIPDAYRQLIFERYERLPSSTDTEGTGLGLAICKSIIESHGGMIDIESPESGGSEFWFSIPIRAPESR